MHIEAQVEKQQEQKPRHPLSAFPIPAFPFSSAVSLAVSPFLVTSNIVVPAGGVAYLPAADATPVI